MKIKKRVKGDILIISVSGEMEAYGAEKLESEVMASVEKEQKDLIIDLASLKYISSSGLRALLNIRARQIELGRGLFLTSLSEEVLDVFRISKLSNIFVIANDIKDAESRRRH